MKLNHINIKATMPFLEKEKKFFCEVLGLKDGFRPQFSKRGYWIYSDDEAVIHLTEAENQNSEMHKGCIDHLAFQSSNAGHFISTLNQLKIEYNTNHIYETKTLQVLLKSPLGIKIEVVFINEKENVSHL